MLAKSFEQTSERLEDNSVDISRKDLNGDEPLANESSRKSCSTRKIVEEDFHVKNQRSRKREGNRIYRQNTSLVRNNQ